MLKPLRSAYCFSRAAAAEKPPTRFVFLSDAADALEMLGYGLLSPLRGGFLPIHAWAARHLDSGNQRAHVLFREGQCAVLLGHHSHAERAFEVALEQRDGDMFLGGIIHRWRALGRARNSDPRWIEDVHAATDMFDFEGREQELADLQRTEAVCLTLVNQDNDRARQLLQDSRESYRRRRERRGVYRSQIALTLIRLPRLGRWLLRLLLP